MPLLTLPLPCPVTVVARREMAADYELELRQRRGNRCHDAYPVKTWYIGPMSQISGVRRSGATCRVLVVEDDFDSAELFSIMIDQAGHDCRIALNATEARTITEDFTPDVAVVDIGLPGESGYELVQHLKRQPALIDCQFIGLSGGDEGPDTPKPSADAGFAAQLTKPVSQELLLAVLGQCAARPELLASACATFEGRRR